MNGYFAVCLTEFYQHQYMKFLLENYKQLALPYPFPVALSFLASPVMLGADNGLTILCFNDDDEVVGAIGALHGTGEHQYEDTHILQIQTVLLLEHYRKTRLLLRSFQFLLQYLEQSNKQVAEIRFWVPGNAEYKRLLLKVAELTQTAGSLDEYRASLSAWQSYATKFRQEVYF